MTVNGKPEINARFSTMSSFLGALAKMFNLIDANLEKHHERTAYLAYMIAREAGLPQEDIAITIYAALTHDIGLTVCGVPLNYLPNREQARRYAEVGAKLMSGFSGSEVIANIIIHCHSSWSEYLSFSEERREAYRRSARMAAVVHLADAVSTMLRQDAPVLNQVKYIRQMAAEQRDLEFSAEAVDAFMRVSEYEFIWLDLRDNPQFLHYFMGDISSVSLDRMLELTTFISHVIDYRSSFTAMHSAGVAASAEVLARLCGMSGDECKMIRIAGHLHDIGKLKVPRAVLEKPGRLSEEEFNLIKEHPYYTKLILMDVEGFAKIADWAGHHHEKLNGRGYPFHFKAADLDIGSRIVSAADIFSAITEVRPYRAGMERKAAMEVLNENVRSGSLDGDIVALLSERYDEVDRAREEAARNEGARYYESIGKITA
ncbi:HD domain-containing protein [bacterium]|nr:HD domain-containing protein [bacterium]